MNLKRLLNDEPEADGHDYHYNAANGWRPHEEYSSSDDPLLSDQSWGEIWSSLLDADFGQAVQDIDLSTPETAQTSLNDAEECIEYWATDNLSHGESTPASSQEESVVPEAIEKICYGMVYRTPVKLMGDMVTVDEKLRASDGFRAFGNRTFDIRPSPGQQLFLLLPDETELGLFNDRVTKALKELIEIPSIQFEAVCQMDLLLETMGRAQKANDAVIRANINIYGPEQSKKEVGKKLSSHRVYLQKPDEYQSGYVYDNPHYLELPGLQQSTSREQPKEVAENDKSKTVDPEQFEKAIEQVYDSLKRSTKLGRVEGDQRLKTKLLPHQEEALDFMIQRETGTIPQEFRLWQPKEMNGQQWFVHSVTNHKSLIQHEERGGGILADEMGMGKSLSILSLIIRTLEGGENWAQEQNASGRINAAKRRSRATLVVVPSALLINGWFEEIKKHLKVSLKVVKYHGQARGLETKAIEEADIVITTYFTLSTEFAIKSKNMSKTRYGNKSSPLHEIEWFRVVLDEAHMIRRQATGISRTVTELTAQHRWCLTGTPIQNRLIDIGVLFGFIRVKPFNNLATFRNRIATPLEETGLKDERALHRLALLIDSLCLRRTRRLLTLPGMEVRQRVLDFSSEERARYEHTRTTMFRAIKQHAGDYDRNNTFGMFQAQLQLRILCNHGTYQHHFTWARRSLLDEREDALSNNIGRDKNVICSLCRGTMPIQETNKIHRRWVEDCAHVLCSECSGGLAVPTIADGDSQQQQIVHCPLCRESGARMPRKQEMKDEEYFHNEGNSTKVTALIEDAKKDLSASKSIVFSCWTRTLNLIQKHLKEEGIAFERIDGECPHTRRQKILDDFADPGSKIPVLIMTTGTGAFGLNLTSANRVFIVEPQWNPSIENQAVARAIRLGQDQKVLVVRYVVRNTIEQEMRSQQERKVRIAALGFESKERERSSGDPASSFDPAAITGSQTCLFSPTDFAIPQVHENSYSHLNQC